jgi:hypothetical protein
MPDVISIEATSTAPFSSERGRLFAAAMKLTNGDWKNEKLPARERPDQFGIGAREFSIAIQKIA